MKLITNEVGNTIFEQLFDWAKEMIKFFENWDKAQQFLLNEWNWNNFTSVFIGIIIAIIQFLIPFAIATIITTILVKALIALINLIKKEFLG